MIEEVEFIPPLPRGDMFLKFTSKEEADAVLLEPASHVAVVFEPDGEDGVVRTEVVEPTVDDEGNQVYKPKWDMYIDEVGVIFKPTGVVDEEGNQEMVALAGWHVNTRGEMPEELSAYSVDPIPLTPARVWA